MKALNQNIVFEVLYEDKLHKIHTRPHEYRNLMVLIRDQLYPDYFGECGGQGRCGTCTIKIIAPEHNLSQTGRNELSTLHKSGLDQPGVRLSCQIMVDEKLQGISIELLDNF